LQGLDKGALPFESFGTWAVSERSWANKGPECFLEMGLGTLEPSESGGVLGKELELGGLGSLPSSPSSSRYKSNFRMQSLQRLPEATKIAFTEM